MLSYCHTITITSDNNKQDQADSPRVPTCQSTCRLVPSWLLTAVLSTVLYGLTTFSLFLSVSMRLSYSCASCSCSCCPLLAVTCLGSKSRSSISPLLLNCPACRLDYTLAVSDRQDVSYASVSLTLFFLLCHRFQPMSPQLPVICTYSSTTTTKPLHSAVGTTKMRQQHRQASMHSSSLNTTRRLLQQGLNRKTRTMVRPLRHTISRGSQIRDGQLSEHRQQASRHTSFSHTQRRAWKRGPFAWNICALQYLKAGYLVTKMQLLIARTDKYTTPTTIDAMESAVLQLLVFCYVARPQMTSTALKHKSAQVSSKSIYFLTNWSIRKRTFTLLRAIISTKIRAGRTLMMSPQLITTSMPSSPWMARLQPKMYLSCASMGTKYSDSFCLTLPPMATTPTDIMYSTIQRRLLLCRTTQTRHPHQDSPMNTHSSTICAVQRVQDCSGQQLSSRLLSGCTANCKLLGRVDRDSRARLPRVMDSLQSTSRVSWLLARDWDRMVTGRSDREARVPTGGIGIMPNTKSIMLEVSRFRRDSSRMLQLFWYTQMDGTVFWHTKLVYTRHSLEQPSPEARLPSQHSQLAQEAGHWEHRACPTSKCPGAHTHSLPFCTLLSLALQVTHSRPSSELQVQQLMSHFSQQLKLGMVLLAAQPGWHPLQHLYSCWMQKLVAAEQGVRCRQCKQSALRNLQPRMVETGKLAMLTWKQSAVVVGLKASQLIPRIRLQQLSMVRGIDSCVKSTVVMLSWPQMDPKSRKLMRVSSNCALLKQQTQQEADLTVELVQRVLVMVVELLIEAVTRMLRSVEDFTRVQSLRKVDTTKSLLLRPVVLNWLSCLPFVTAVKPLTPSVSQQQMKLPNRLWSMARQVQVSLYMIVPDATAIVDLKSVRVIALTVTVQLSTDVLPSVISMTISPRATVGEAVRLLKNGCTKESDWLVVSPWMALCSPVLSPVSMRGKLAYSNDTPRLTRPSSSSGSSRGFIFEMNCNHCNNNYSYIIAEGRR